MHPIQAAGGLDEHDHWESRLISRAMTPFAGCLAQLRTAYVAFAGPDINRFVKGVPNSSSLMFAGLPRTLLYGLRNPASDSGFPEIKVEINDGVTIFGI
jgi:hypothetical protein